ncbi:hypothetical protein TPDSL_13690 [Terrisporobacter petrolearius]|uniref:helix-turn-helix domain-containing protein n=1 Tax=Terrisporobacter petrolearius TaxID=1460447 RepID=UPI003366678D
MIGENIKTLRTFLDLTQEEFAKQVNLERNTIALVERNKRNLSDKSINLICTRFNVNKDWLNKNKGNMFLETISDNHISFLMGQLDQSENEELIKQIFYKLCKLDSKYLNIIDEILDTWK